MSWSVVTGASSGIGRAIAEGLAAKGQSVVLVARREAELQSLAATLARHPGMQTRVVALDLGAADSADRLDAATADLDVATVVLNAGFGTSGPFLDGDTAAELSMIDVNCGAVLASSRLFGRRLAARGGGDLVLLSSVLAFQGAPLAAAYGATKAFVQSLAEALDVELAPRGVRVLSAAVGPTRSGFADVARMDLDVAMDADTVGRAIVRQVGGRGTIRPGWLSIALTLLTAPLPRWIATRIFGRAMATMTG